MELQTFLRIFMVIWIMCGAAWVYGCDRECRERCDSLTFDLAFWTITSILLLLAFFIICGPVILRVLNMVLNRRNSERGNEDAEDEERAQRLHQRLAAELEAEAAEYAERDASASGRRAQRTGEDAAEEENEGVEDHAEVARSRESVLERLLARLLESENGDASQTVQRAAVVTEDRGEVENRGGEGGESPAGRGEPDAEDVAVGGAGDGDPAGSPTTAAAQRRHTSVSIPLQSSIGISEV